MSNTPMRLGDPTTGPEVPALATIIQAMYRVEELGAHRDLTDAVILLGQAHRKVREWYSRERGDEYDQSEL